MPLFECDPKIELNGHNTYALLSSILHSDFKHIVEKHGFTEIDREAWYSLQKVLDVLKDISQAQGAMMNLVSIGMAAAENIELPPDVASLPPDRFLKLYEQLFSTRHRNGSPGSVTAEVLAPGHVRVTLDADVPYPDDVMYGVFYGYMRRLESVKDFTIAYDEELPRKEHGGHGTVMHVTWTA